MNFFWRAIEKMGCLFSKRKSKSNTYLYKEGDENKSVNGNADSSTSATSSTSGGFGSGGVSTSGSAKVRSLIEEFLEQKLLAFFSHSRIILNMDSLSRLRNIRGMNVQNLIRRTLCL